MTDEKGFETKETEAQVEQLEQGGVPGVDELALRLQVEPATEPFEGVVLFGKSGRAYSFTTMMAHHIQFVSEAFQLTLNILEQMKKEGEKFEHNQKPRQPKKTNHPNRNFKGDKSK